jgi:hypothetical protein
MQTKARIPSRWIGPVVIAGAFACSTVESRDWAFMESVGGVAVHKAYRQNGVVYLPVECNVSGLRAVTVSPWTINSALVIARVEATRSNEVIYVRVFTRLADGEHGSAECVPVALEAIPSGSYQVLYGAPGKASGLGVVAVEP